MQEGLLRQAIALLKAPKVPEGPMPTSSENENIAWPL